MSKPEKNCSIPALKLFDGNWALTPTEKAEELSRSFEAKVRLPEAVVNEFTVVEKGSSEMSSCCLLRVRSAKQTLIQLSETSATGPDLLPSIILKQCAAALAIPFTKLARRIVSVGVWPAMWRSHWVCPIFKKKDASNADCYRGVHLTAQMSKAMERYVGKLFLPFLEKTIAYGPNQFAYAKGRGGRDALLHTTLSWIWELCNGRKIAVFCSDVSGAFDKVRASRLLEKLAAKGVNEQLLRLLRSWLAVRSSVVIVGGKKSAARQLWNMVFQGTVWGPPLWNSFFEDARRAVAANLFSETVYADDLIAFRAFLVEVSNSCLDEAMRSCQDDLHRWGNANQATFDPAKESFHIISRQSPQGENFVELGVEFDTRLVMRDAVHQCAAEAGWKIKAVLRPQRFFTTTETVKLYKTHVLSIIEYRTPAIAHAAPSILLEIDRLQPPFPT